MRPVLPGKARTGRGLNFARKGSAQASLSRRLDWLKTLARKGSQALAVDHFRHRKLPAGASVLHLVLLDMSSSMLRAGKLARAKGYLLALMQQAYRDREHVGVIGFGGQGAHWVQQPAKAQTFNESWIAPLGGGGGTPLESGLRLLSSALHGSKRLIHVWVMTDGRLAQIPERPQGMDLCTIVDFELDGLRLRRCEALAEQWAAQWIAPDCNP